MTVAMQLTIDGREEPRPVHDDRRVPCFRVQVGDNAFRLHVGTTRTYR